MKDTLAFRMLGDSTLAKQAITGSKIAFEASQKSKRITNKILGNGPKNREYCPSGDENYLSDTERNYIDFLICDGTTEFELRQIESEIQLGLHGRPSETLSHTFHKKNGEKVETILKMTMCPDTYNMQLSSFSLEEFLEKCYFYVALEKYITLRMSDEGYLHSLKTSGYPGILRFGKEPIQYVEQCAKVETHPTAEYYALLGIAR